jgi:cell division protein FtsI (penicillin-binding protein 3)
VDDKPTHDWRRTQRRRLGVAAAIFLLWSCAIEARLVFLQVLQHDALVARAENQQSDTITLAARRGEILDRQGRLLAFSVDAETVFAEPGKVTDKAAAIAALCEALGDCTARDRDTLRQRLERKHFAIIRRQISPDQARRVAALKLDGIDFLKENKRFYPNKGLASHLLGYVGTEDGGLSGIESTYDTLIKGKPGTVLVQTDARRHAFNRLERPATAGASLELTIDEYLQHIVERELRVGAEWANAKGASAVVMDPETGEILALANYPSFNPNAYREFDDDARRNRAIQDLYEPGSTFKLVTAGAALEEGLFTPETIVETGPGVIRFGSRVIDEDKGHNYGTLSFANVIVKSSNVGAIKIGLRVGSAKMADYVKRFGFGRPTSPDFRGESAGIARVASMKDSALASVSMGYEIGVTPLQMATAVSVVANGGELLQPRLVRAVIRDGQRLPVPRKVLGRAVSKGTAAQLTGIMESVVVDGTGKNAKVEGYTVAGKTGTAAKIVNRRYSTTDYNVSFVGFIPSRAPRYAIVVVVDTPRGVPLYGSTVAAPIFQRIAAAALRHEGVAPTINAPPPLLVTRQQETAEIPTSGQAENPAVVTLAGISKGGNTGGSTVFPDLRGLSAREALHALAQLGMTPKVRGHGQVTAQDPAAGSPIDIGITATLWLDRQTAAAAPTP